MARIRERAEDFRVEEVPLYEPRGEGDHTFVHIEKRLRTTEEVARSLARAGGCSARDVGYAGRKDRVAVTTQWFSVPRLAPEEAVKLELPGAVVLEARRHPHKLRVGQLRANRFRLVVRDVDPLQIAEASRTLNAFTRSGMPNAYGPQRFGRDGGNTQRALALLRGELELRDRRQARFLVSSLQAWVFNEVLAARRRGDPGELDRVVEGDVACLHGSGGLFWVEDTGREGPRAKSFEISATGPIFGTRVLEPRGRVAEVEAEAMRCVGLSSGKLRPPRGIRLRGARRALRVRPANAQLQGRNDRADVCFELPSGSFASVLMEELFPGVVSGSGARE
ncbi:tRNA pseudouridine(13) synthase TruD [Myxococcota bacterium]|nr:tRNA pseudouridine(13) synthase TruD [Myxococcota bacterium]